MTTNSALAGETAIISIAVGFDESTYRLTSESVVLDLAFSLVVTAPNRNMI